MNGIIANGMNNKIKSIEREYNEKLKLANNCEEKERVKEWYKNQIKAANKSLY